MSHIFFRPKHLSHTANISSLSASCLHKWQQKQTAATRSTKHNKLFQPITDKMPWGWGLGSADEEDGESI